MDMEMNFYTDEIILISGGAGAIGSNLSRKLAESGAAKVIILDDLSVSYKWNIPNLPNILFVIRVVSRMTMISNACFTKSPLIFFI